MDNVEIEFSRIDKFKVGIELDDESKELVAVIQMKCPVHPEDIARVLNLEAHLSPLYCKIGSKQAELDLKFEQVNVKTGEIGEVKKLKQ